MGSITDNNNIMLPRHIGIIMDGNGRWAKKRLLPRTAGHVQGAKVFKQITRYCMKLGIECVTFYAFSTENWKRPKEEVDAIMNLFNQYLDDAMTMTEENVRLIFPGNTDMLSEELRVKINKLTKASDKNTGLTCCIAINYGGRDDIVHAVKNIVKDNIPEAEINEETVSDRLYTKGLPEVDLIIRPSGEQRLSNFLIWQAAYAEYVFMDVLWPDFKESDLDFAIGEYNKRNRRYGGI